MKEEGRQEGRVRREGLMIKRHSISMSKAHLATQLTLVCVSKLRVPEAEGRGVVLCQSLWKALQYPVL